MAEVTETNELHTIIILKYKLLSKLYTNELPVKSFLHTSPPFFSLLFRLLKTWF